MDIQPNGAGALEYKVDVPGMPDTYRILKLANGVDASGNIIYKYGYTTNHYKTVYDFIPLQ